MAAVSARVCNLLKRHAAAELERTLDAAAFERVINSRNSARLVGLQDSFEAIARASGRRQLSVEDFRSGYLGRVRDACASKNVPADLQDDIVRIQDLNLRERTNAADETKLTATDRRYLDAVARGDLETAQAMVDAAAERAGVPRRTLKAYKMFRTLKTRPGEIFPLFIGKTEPTEVGKWIPAEHIPTEGFAPRSGWHAGTLPTAPHLMKKDGSMPEDRLWAEIEVAADVDYQPVADASSTRDIRGRVPEGGFYRFKTNKMQGGAWVIGGAIKIVRLLSNAEADRITKAGKIAEPSRSSDTAAVVYDRDGNVVPLSRRFAKAR